MDYLTAGTQRSMSFKDFMEEWIVDQFFRTLDEFGLKKPWYWDIFLDQLEIYHHMIYASAYTSRATLWFDFEMPSPAIESGSVRSIQSTGTTWTRCGAVLENDGRPSARPPELDVRAWDGHADVLRSVPAAA
jgi:hypothetical protein